MANRTCVTPERRREAVELLHGQGCSCVVCNGERMETMHERGVKDLLRLLKTERGLLDGAFIADKVVGKGAAALMVIGGVREVYADVISEPALALLDGAGVQAEYAVRAANIINRSGTGICPVERLCMECRTAEECLPLIEDFIRSKATK